MPSVARVNLVCYMTLDIIELALSEMHATALEAGQNFIKDDGKELEELLKVVSKATRGLKKAKFKASAAWAVAKATRAGGNTADALAGWYGRRVVPGMRSALSWVKKAMIPKRGNANDQSMSIGGEGEGEGEEEEEEEED